MENKISHTNQGTTARLDRITNLLGGCFCNPRFNNDNNRRDNQFEMNLYFTKIEWAGSDCILVTDSNNPRKPILILDKNDIEVLNKTFNQESIKKAKEALKRLRNRN